MLKLFFTRLLEWILHRPSHPSTLHEPADSTEENTPLAEALNQRAPLVTASPHTITGQQAEKHDAAIPTDTFLCREAVLGRTQHIVGYQFMLQHNRLNHIRTASRRIHHFCAKALVSTLTSFGFERLLGNRLVFLDLPDSFLTDPDLARLPPRNTVFVITPLTEPGAPSPDALRQTVAQLQKRGYRIAIPDPTVVTEYAFLLPQTNIVLIRTPPGTPLNTAHMLNLQQQLASQSPHVSLLVRDLPAQEDFNFCYKMQATYFQGAFITHREDWNNNQLRPNQAHLTMLLSRLRKNADTDEIVDLIKHDPNLSLRLLRYVNSAANGLNSKVSSIKHAFVLFGRERLFRWLILLLYTLEGKTNTPQQSAVLESALIRARMMETVAYRRSNTEREELFLTGLLSLIDIILEVPLEKALRALTVPEIISEAILHQKGPYANLLGLAIAFEKNDMLQAHKIAAESNILLSDASKTYLDALAWTMLLNSDEAEAQQQ